MKRIIFGTMLLFAFGSTMNAIGQTTGQTTTTTTVTSDQNTNANHMRYKYYYYPSISATSSDVYYNTVTGDYWYYDTPSTTWMSVKTLPSGYTVDDNSKYVVYYNGNDVYKDNPMHKKKYKVKKDGTVKSK